MASTSRARRILELSAFAVALCAFSLTPAAWAEEHGHGFVGHRGVAFYPTFGWGWGWSGPFWGDYGWPYYFDDTGTVKLENAAKTDSVYINGSFAGPAKKFQSIYLEPGKYTIAVKRNGQDILYQQVYVIAGKTAKLDVGDKAGTVKFKNASKQDQVYVNGAYKGELGSIKSIHLDPGRYDVTITNHGRSVLDRKIDVPSNETVYVTVGDKG